MPPTEQTDPDVLSRGSAALATRTHLWLAPPQPYVVGAEVLGGQEPRAHVVPDLGSATARHGIAVCGLPVEALILMMDMTWDQVEPPHQCSHCTDVT